jgi:hypothetical protein
MKKATTKQSGPHVNCRLSQISIQLPFNQLVNWDFAFGEALGVGNIQQLRSPCTARTGQRSGTASQKRRTLSTAARTDLALGPSECGSGRNSPRRTNELLQLRHGDSISLDCLDSRQPLNISQQFLLCTRIPTRVEKMENWGKWRGNLKEGERLTNHKPPNRSLLSFGQVWVRLINDHDCTEDNRSADGGEDAQKHRDRPLVCKVVCDLDLEGVVVVICDHEGRGGRIEGQVEDCHCCD